MKEKFNRTAADIKDYKIRLAKSIFSSFSEMETISGTEMNCFLLAVQTLHDYDIDPYEGEENV